MHQPDPEFPPLLKGRGVKGAGKAFETACAGAADGTLGAGDVVWGRDVARVEVAIVLEPEVPFATAAQMMPLAMVSVGDTVGTLAPPQVGVTFTWPNVVRVNAAQAGAVRAAVPVGAEADQVPPWMVVGLWLRHLRGPKDPEPGAVPDITWLAEEGCGHLTRTELIEAYCRHFLAWLHQWQTEGFRPVHASWLHRAHEREAPMSVAGPGEGEAVTGAFVGLDDGGNLLLKTGAGETRALHLADWFERCGSD